MLELLLALLSKQFLFFALHFDNKTVFPKPLSAKAERECFERLAAGDRTAKDKLIEHNLRLVAHMIKKYYALAHDRDDLISIGTVGLIKAVNTFDCTKGSRFATYASRCIENPIHSLRTYSGVSSHALRLEKYAVTRFASSHRSFSSSKRMRIADQYSHTAQVAS